MTQTKPHIYSYLYIIQQQQQPITHAHTSNSCSSCRLSSLTVGVRREEKKNMYALRSAENMMNAKDLAMLLTSCRAYRKIRALHATTNTNQEIFTEKPTKNFAHLPCWCRWIAIFSSTIPYRYYYHCLCVSIYRGVTGTQTTYSQNYTRQYPINCGANKLSAYLYIV